MVIRFGRELKWHFTKNKYWSFGKKNNKEKNETIQNVSMTRKKRPKQVQKQGTKTHWNYLKQKNAGVHCATITPLKI